MADDSDAAALRKTEGATAGPDDGVLHHLKVVGVRMGSNAAQALATGAATSTVAKQLLMTSYLAETRVAASTMFAAKAQLQSCATVVLKLPVKGETMDRLAALIRTYVAQHPDVVEQLAALPAAEQVFVAGVEGNVITAVASLAVQQAFLSCLWLRSGDTVEDLKQSSMAATAGTAGCLTGSVVGAAVGTLLVPGIGTSVGSLLGGFAGAQAIAYVVPYPTHEEKEKEQPWNPSRELVIREVGSDQEWLEISDATTVQRFKCQFDSMNDLLSTPMQRTTAPSHSGSQVPVVSSSAFVEIPTSNTDVGDDEIVVLLGVDRTKQIPCKK